MRLLFHGFVVLVGTLILAGAVNTAIIGSNGVLNRVAEDGVLPDWFRHPHKKFGTTSRLINLIVVLQLITILISRGDVYMLGEAYAFGVVWSFAMKALSVLVLRYKQPGRPRMEGAAEFPHRQDRDPGRPGDHHGGAVRPGHHQRAHQEGGHHLRASASPSRSSSFSSSPRSTTASARPAHAAGAWRSSGWIRATKSPPTAVSVRPGNVLVAVRNPQPAAAPGSAFWRRPTRASMDIVVLSVRPVTQAGFGRARAGHRPDLLRRRNRRLHATW